MFETGLPNVERDDHPCDCGHTRSTLCPCARMASRYPAP